MRDTSAALTEPPVRPVSSRCNPEQASISSPGTANASNHDTSQK